MATKTKTSKTSKKSKAERAEESLVDDTAEEVETLNLRERHTVSYDDNSNVESGDHDNDSVQDDFENKRWMDNWKKMLKTDNPSVNTNSKLKDLSKLEKLFDLYEEGRRELNPYLARQAYWTAMGLCGRPVGPHRRGGSKNNRGRSGSKESRPNRSGSKTLYKDQ